MVFSQQGFQCRQQIPEGVTWYDQQEVVRASGRLFKIAFNFQRRWQICVGQITLVAPGSFQFLEVLRVPAPDQNRSALARKLDGQRGTPGAGAQYAYRLVGWLADSV